MTNCIRDKCKNSGSLYAIQNATNDHYGYYVICDQHYNESAECLGLIGKKLNWVKL